MFPWVCTTIMILWLFALNDLLGYQCSGMCRSFLPVLCIQKGDGNKIVSCLIENVLCSQCWWLPQVCVWHHIPQWSWQWYTLAQCPTNQIIKQCLSCSTQGWMHPSHCCSWFSALWLPSKPLAHVHDADNTCGLSASGSSMRKCALSSATDPPVPIKKATMRILSPLDTDNEDIPSPDPASSNELIPQPDEDKDTDEVKSENGGATRTVHTSLFVLNVFLCWHMPQNKLLFHQRSHGMFSTANPGCMMLSWHVKPQNITRTITIMNSPCISIHHWRRRMTLWHDGGWVYFFI